MRKLRSTKLLKDTISMEDAIRKELVDLCREIVSNGTQADTDNLLKKTRLLEEKLLLLRYFQYREESEIQVPERDPDMDKYDRELEETLQRAEASHERAGQGSSASPITPQGVPSSGQDFSAVSKQTGMTEEKSPEGREETPKVEPQPIQDTPIPKQRQAESEKEEPSEPSEAPVEKEKLKEDKPPQEAPQAPQRERERPLEKQRSLHQRYSGGQIKLGLNDRLAFTNHLFEGNQEDLNRVVSQLNTFSSYAEAEDFIQNMVKPDYDWSNKQEYEERFMKLVRARFGEE